MDMRRRKLYLFIGVIAFVAIARYILKLNQPEVYDVHSGTHGDHESRKELRTGNSRAIVVFSEEDTCLKWRKAFPNYRIIIVGSRTQSGGHCIYKKKINDITRLLSNKLEVAFVAIDDEPSAVSCVENIIEHRAKRRRFDVLYSNPTEVAYQPRRHYGCGGFPIEDKIKPYKLCENDRDSQVLVGVYSDGRSCDQVYPPMILERGTYWLANLHCAALEKSALWMLPFLVESSMENNIGVKLIANKLLWQSGLNIEVMLSTEGQRSSSSDPELGNLENVAAILSKASCDDSTFLQCFDSFSKTVEESGIFVDARTDQLHKWLLDLQSVGYKFPNVATSATRKCSNYNSLQSVVSTKDRDHGKNQGVNIEQRKDLQLKTCSDSTKDTHNFKEPWLHYDNVVLIVTYNNNEHYDTIPYFETLYRHIFPHIVYCGPGIPNWDHASLKDISFSFMSYAETPESLKSTKGALHYECFVKVTGMGFKVAGYIETSDDILMNVHRFRHYNTSHTWYWQLNNAIRVNTYNHDSCDDRGCKSDNRNGKFWHKFRPAVSAAISELNNLKTDLGRRCNDNREKLYGGKDWHIRVISDTYYVPSRYADDVATLMEIFIRNKVYLEIAIPTILHCVIPQSSFDPVYMFLHNLEHPIQGPYSHENLLPSNPNLAVLSILDRNVIKKPVPRQAIWHYVTPPLMRGAAIFHPHKLGHVAAGEDRHVKFFCDVLRFFGDETGDADKYLTE